MGKNKPNNPKLWSRAKAAARAKFDTYPSAYANLWASKWYKKKGGTWRTSENLEEVFREENYLGLVVKDIKTGIVYKIRAIEFPFTHSSQGQFNIYNAVNVSTGQPIVTREDDDVMCEVCAKALLEDIRDGKMPVTEAEYKGRQVKLGKPFRTPAGPKKFSVYVRNEKGNVVKVNFGDKGLSIKRDDPKRKKAFRARHKCSQKKDRTSAGYWSCRLWSSKPVSQILKGK
jgi:hypothetical protein